MSREGRSHMHYKVRGWHTWTPWVHPDSFLTITVEVYLTDIQLSLPCCRASTILICIDQLVASCMLKQSLWSCCCLCLFNKRLAQQLFSLTAAQGIWARAGFASAAVRASLSVKTWEKGGTEGFRTLGLQTRVPLLVPSSLWQPMTSAFCVCASLGSWHCVRFMLTLSWGTTPTSCATTRPGQRTITWLSRMNTAMVRAGQRSRLTSQPSWAKLPYFVFKYGMFWLTRKQTVLGLHLWRIQ